ncbi:MAG TPA: ADOP family duplicated permease [Gemmatimonadaceae bacterium]|nr:ADOP family duplicated permease [Gemmatimonadaceae bacterium]
MSAPPPRLAERFLAALLPADVREEALDDLADLHAARLTSSGRTAADAWYWRQLPRFALRLRFAHALGGSLASPSPRYSPDPPREKKMHSLLADLRHAARSTLRHRGFTAIAVVTLALGIGASASIFSVVRSVLLRPLPFPEPERLVDVWETRPERDMFQISFTYANFWDVLEMNRSFESMGAIRWSSMTYLGDKEPARLSVASTTVGFFQALGAAPVVGRLFVDGEDAKGADTHLAVLSHAFWASRFGQDRSIVGRSLTLDRETYRVIGVLPPGTPWLDAAEVFIPFTRPAQLNRDSWELPVIGRLARGMTLKAAGADMQRIATRLSEQYPEAKGMGIRLGTSDSWVASDSLRRALWVLIGAVGFLLLIACVNLANMLLARSTSRGRERALRAALGATRGRVVQLALAESAVLGILGAAAGLALAFGIVRMLRSFNPGDIPRLAEAQVDGWVLLVTLGTALATSLAAGLVPGLRTPYHDVVSAIREGERSVAGHRRLGRVRHALVAIEVALSIVLLVGAGLLVRSFGRVLGVDRGFVTENRVMVDVGLPPASRADSARAPQLLVNLLERLRSIPQVTSAAVVHVRPLQGAATGMGFGAADRPDATGREVPWAGWRIISNNYFKTLGLPLIAGRDFTEQDKIGEPWKVIISKRIADLLWPGENAVGRRLVLWKGQGTSSGEVIGVVGDMRDWGLTDDPTYSVYLPVYGTSLSPAYVVLHTTLSTATLVPMLRSVLAEVDPTVPISGATTLDEIVGDSVAARRFTMLLLAALAVVALILALAGIYGVLSYAVSQRRSEMGLRMALGASGRSVLRLVMLQGMRPVVIGLAVGIVGALALSRFMTSLLFGMTPADWPTYTAVAALLAGAAVLACYVPARDALSVDVTATLRDE